MAEVDRSRTYPPPFDGTTVLKTARATGPQPPPCHELFSFPKKHNTHTAHRPDTERSADATANRKNGFHRSSTRDDPTLLDDPADVDVEGGEMHAADLPRDAMAC